MSDPPVVDLRGGLTQEFFSGLRQAERVLLAVKGVHTAVLGYWIGDELSVGLIASAVSRVVLVPHRVDLRIGSPIGPLRHRERLQSVVLDISHAQDDEFWSRVLGVLRVGDMLRVTHDAEAPSRAALQITSHGAHIASLRLPKTPRARAEGQSAA